MIDLKKIKYKNCYLAELNTIIQLDNENNYKALKPRHLEYILTNNNLSVKLIIHNNIIIGYYILRKAKDEYILLRLLVESKCRQLGVGSGVINDIKSKLRPNYKHTIRAVVDERNIIAQLFFKKNGFKWVQTVKNDESGYDLYCMYYSILNTGDKTHDA